MTAGVVEFLSQPQAGDKPFFLLAGYLAPHFPLIVPEKYWEHYKGKVPMPVIPQGFLEPCRSTTSICASGSTMRMCRPTRSEEAASCTTA